MNQEIKQHRTKKNAQETKLRVYNGVTPPSITYASNNWVKQKNLESKVTTKK